MTAREPAGRLLTPADVPWIVALVAAYVGIRLAYWSGFGLGDDPIFFHNIALIVQNSQVAPDNIAYRFSWWLPTALSCRLLGLNEVGLIAPTTVMAAVGVVVVYALGKALWGLPGAVIAALLLIVCPLDFAWSTMFVNDFFAAVLCATTVLLVLRAPLAGDVLWRRRLWTLAGVTLWLAYHAKVSVVLLFPALAIICFARREQIDRELRYFVGTAAALYALSALGSYVFAGDPFAPYHVENRFGGAVGAGALTSHPLTYDVFLTYPRLLFYPDHLGDRLFSFYPHLLVTLAVAGPLLGLRSAWPIFWWLCFVFLGMQLAVNHVDGGWTSLARNVRHTIVFVYPLILLLTGYLVALRARWRWVCDVLVAALLVVGLRESVRTALKTQEAFGDRRQALTFIASLPPKAIFSDFQLCTYMPVLVGMRSQYPCVEVAGDEAARKARLETIQSGYLVTGGGREPHYGCFECIPLAREVPVDQWRLLREFPGPAVPQPWRPEAVRVWERVRSEGTAPSGGP
jgi:hypothetical protein